MADYMFFFIFAGTIAVIVSFVPDNRWVRFVIALMAVGVAEFPVYSASTTILNLIGSIGFTIAIAYMISSKRAREASLRIVENITANN
ncbi:hypothetical protein [Hahella ganghwensis]|uniref:hypothetical protein n=1 Tax=Hahella ganghwensis TaxID=286420 RepID=UPI00037DD2D1|nr:hypothetical protein [Hahella ganghwensis]